MSGRLAHSLVAAYLIVVTASVRAESATPQPLFDANAKHLWNRLHRTLWVRTSAAGKEFGHDRLDPLLWANSRHLLEGASHRDALAVLDEFLTSHGERLINDPAKRAILQRDLWSVFDWSVESSRVNEVTVPRPREALQRRLAQAIHRLTLFSEQIADLPDTYERTVASKRYPPAYDPAHPETPFLPPDLFDAYGPWINLTVVGEEVVAPGHLEAFGARSSFSVLFRHPTSREEGVKYFAALRRFKEPWIPEDPADEGNMSRVINPKLPQFPAGTQLALVRRMLLPDAHGQVRATPVVESIQLRVQRDAPRPGRSQREEPIEQDVHEFKLSRAALFRDGAGLHAVGADEQDFRFVQFRGHGHDPFAHGNEPRTLIVINTCAQCHRGRGIFTMNSATESRHYPPRSLPELVDRDRDYQDRVTIARKHQRYDYGLLRGLILKETPANVP